MGFMKNYRHIDFFLIVTYQSMLIQPSYWEIIQITGTRFSPNQPFQWGYQRIPSFHDAPAMSWEETFQKWLILSTYGCLQMGYIATVYPHFVGVFYF
jgi:hypothetical protein